MTADAERIRDRFAERVEIPTRRLMGGLPIATRSPPLGQILPTDRDGPLPLRVRGAFEDLTAMGARSSTSMRSRGTGARMATVSLPDAALDDPALACDLARRSLTQE